MQQVRQSDKRRKVRTSVTLPAESYEQLAQIAERKKASVAWVVREAVEHYLSSDRPLFKNR